MVSPGGVEHPPRPLLQAPPEATELLLLGARPPQRPLTHFTLCWWEGREARGGRGHGCSPGPGCAPASLSRLLSASAPGQRHPDGPEGIEVPRETQGVMATGFLCAEPSPRSPWGPLPPGPPLRRPRPRRLTRAAALHGAVGRRRALGTGAVAAAFVQVQALLTFGAEVVAEAGLAVLNLAF